jgi:4-hydroxybenzoate polyprenyltransferase
LVLSFVFTVLTAFFSLIRLPNLLLLAISLVVAYWLPPGNCFLPLFTVVNWVAAIVCTAAGGYVINDCADVAIDSINKSQRPIPAGNFSVKQATLIAICLFISGLFFSLINKWLILLTIVSVLTLIAYARRLKCMPLIGNLTVAVLSAASFASLRLLCGEVDDTLYELTLFAGLTHFLREQVKCLEDVAGDSLMRCCTLPVIIGVPTAKKVALITVLLIIIACGGMAAAKEGIITFAWLFLSVLFCIFAWQLQLAKLAGDFAKLATSLKLLMIIGIAVVLLSAIYQ